MYYKEENKQLFCYIGKKYCGEMAAGEKEIGYEDYTESVYEYCYFDVATTAQSGKLALHTTESYSDITKLIENNKLIGYTDDKDLVLDYHNIISFYRKLWLEGYLNDEILNEMAKQYKKTMENDEEVAHFSK